MKIHIAIQTDDIVEIHKSHARLRHCKNGVNAATRCIEKPREGRHGSVQNDRMCKVRP